MRPAITQPAITSTQRPSATGSDGRTEALLDYLLGAADEGGGASASAGNPVLIGAATVARRVVAVFLAYNANKGLPFVPTYDSRPSCRRREPGRRQRGPGRRRGIVHRHGITAGEDRRRPSSPCSTEARARPDRCPRTPRIIRPRSPLGLKYVELSAGQHGGDSTTATIPLATNGPGRARRGLQHVRRARPATGARRRRELGNAIAGRGGDLTAPTGPTAAAPAAEPAMRNLADTRDRLRRFVLGATPREAAPVAEIQAERSPTSTDGPRLRAVARSASRSHQLPPAEALGTRRSRPFLRQAAVPARSTALFRRTAPGARALSRQRGDPRTRSTDARAGAALNGGSASLETCGGFAEDPRVPRGIAPLTTWSRPTTLREVTAPLRHAATTSACGRATPALLGRRRGHLAAVNFGPAGPEQRGRPVEEFSTATRPKPTNLHVNPYLNTGPGTRECEAGNEPYLAGRIDSATCPGPSGRRPRAEAQAMRRHLAPHEQPRRRTARSRSLIVPRYLGLSHEEDPGHAPRSTRSSRARAATGLLARAHRGRPGRQRQEDRALQRQRERRRHDGDRGRRAADPPDATAKIRPRMFLEGNFFVDLQPASRPPRNSTRGTRSRWRRPRPRSSSTDPDQAADRHPRGPQGEIDGLGDALAPSRRPPRRRQDPSTPRRDLRRSGNDACEATRGCAAGDRRRALRAETGRPGAAVQDAATPRQAPRRGAAGRAIATSQAWGVLADEQALERHDAEARLTLGARYALAALNDAFPPRARAAQVLPGLRETPATLGRAAVDAAARALSVRRGARGVSSTPPAAHLAQLTTSRQAGRRATSASASTTCSRPPRCDEDGDDHAHRTTASSCTRWRHGCRTRGELRRQRQYVRYHAGGGARRSSSASARTGEPVANTRSRDRHRTEVPAGSRRSGPLHECWTSTVRHAGARRSDRPTPGAYLSSGASQPAR